ncbi:MAG: TRAP transporter large permease [Gammaproteobacteria bacterium]|nr:TRAP transporter large permease [Gammaproteobacteria bacterium]MDH4253544.1 TRAP transporter large permease [Gammaproteobacteria bacterium]MDH5310116.1 TRAP transporter large permease [Gammaproteobacteria bacterium]
MTELQTGISGVAVLLVLLLAGMPIGISLGLVGFVGLGVILGLEPALIKAGVIVVETLTRYELGTLPLFLLMAHLCSAANASRDFFDAAARLIGHRRGGLAFASVGGCAAFGAVNGSSLATAATMGLVALPEMRKRGYSDSLATGCIAAGGTLGQMIPPSGALIVFGIIAEQSIGRLFTAAIVPGLTQLGLYFVVIWLVSAWRPEAAPPSDRSDWAQRLAAIGRVWDLLALVLLVICGIAIGWLTPTEAASIGAVGALLLCRRRRRLNLDVLRSALQDTLVTSGLIFAVIIGSLIFSVFISVTGVADAVAGAAVEASLGPVASMLLVAAALLLLGSVLDGLALMLLATPIVMPIVAEAGLSPIWFGIFLVRAMEIGFVHPPIGLNLYVIQGIAPDVSLGQIFRGVIPFLVSDLFHLLLLILFPAMVLWLPGLLR